MSSIFCEKLESRRLLTAGVPRFDHVVVIVEENHDYADILGPGSQPSILWSVVPPSQLLLAPYMHKLARQGASLQHMHGVDHPSQPNYLAMFSGSTQGVTSDATPPAPFRGPSLGGQLIAKGLSFVGYSEDLPSVGFTGTESGDYARKHAPWVSFADVPASSNQPISAFPSDFTKLPTVSFVIPNQQHDMHSGSIRAADDWLKSHLGGYAGWAKSHNSLLIVTWDEGRSDNHIPTIFFGAQVRKIKSPLAADHYRLLRTIESMYDLEPLGNALNTAPMRKLFKQPAPTATTMSVMPTTTIFSDQPVMDSAWRRLDGSTSAL